MVLSLTLDSVFMFSSVRLRPSRNDAAPPPWAQRYSLVGLLRGAPTLEVRSTVSVSCSRSLTSQARTYDGLGQIRISRTPSTRFDAGMNAHIDHNGATNTHHHEIGPGLHWEHCLAVDVIVICTAWYATTAHFAIPASQKRRI